MEAGPVDEFLQKASAQRKICAKLSDVFTIPLDEPTWARLQNQNKRYKFLDSDVATMSYAELKTQMADTDQQETYLLKGFHAKGTQLYYTQKWWEFLPSAQPDLIREHALPNSVEMNDNAKSEAWANMCSKVDPASGDFGCYWKDIEPFNSATNLNSPPTIMKNLCFSFAQAAHMLGKAVHDFSPHLHLPRRMDRPLLLLGSHPIFVPQDVDLY